jgi:hypothetical protein
MNLDSTASAQSAKRRSQPAPSIAIAPADSRSQPRLKASVLKPIDLSEDECAQMFLLMRQYYADITESRFHADLGEKTHVILLRDARNGIRGFSTLLTGEVTNLESSARSVRFVFSGDTVVDREFWGQKQLGLAFLKYLFREKLRHPLQPVYWMLMSKGYKTYLLMANNFSTHYPRFEKKTPVAVQEILEKFYSDKFGELFDRASGLMIPVGPSCRLRDGVAAVTDELRAELPRVDFFARRNPGWDDGVELACIAEMRLLMPFKYFMKKMRDVFVRVCRGTK